MKNTQLFTIQISTRLWSLKPKKSQTNSETIKISSLIPMFQKLRRDADAEGPRLLCSLLLQLLRSLLYCNAVGWVLMLMEGGLGFSITFTFHIFDNLSSPLICWGLFLLLLSIFFAAFWFNFSIPSLTAWQWDECWGWWRLFFRFHSPFFLVNLARFWTWIL